MKPPPQQCAGFRKQGAAPLDWPRTARRRSPRYSATEGMIPCRCRCLFPLSRLMPDDYSITTQSDFDVFVRAWEGSANDIRRPDPNDNWSEPGNVCRARCWCAVTFVGTPNKS